MSDQQKVIRDFEAIMQESEDVIAASKMALRICQSDILELQKKALNCTVRQDPEINFWGMEEVFSFVHTACAVYSEVCQKIVKTQQDCDFEILKALQEIAVVTVIGLESFTQNCDDLEVCVELAKAASQARNGLNQESERLAVTVLKLYQSNLPTFQNAA